jgi:hypothetical protein
LGISKVLDFLNSGADRTSMLHLEKETFNTYLPKLFETDKSWKSYGTYYFKTIEKDYLFLGTLKINRYKTKPKPALKIIIRKIHVKIYTL